MAIEDLIEKYLDFETGQLVLTEELRSEIELLRSSIVPVEYSKELAKNGDIVSFDAGVVWYNVEDLAEFIKQKQQKRKK